MICPTCKSLIYDRHISCATCAARKSAEASAEYQRQVLRNVAGELMLQLRAIKGVRHVKLFGEDRTWCNLPVELGHRQSRAYYHDLEGPRLCASCMAALRQALEEVAQK